MSEYTTAFAFGRTWTDTEGSTHQDIEARDHGEVWMGRPIYRLYARGIRVGDVEVQENGAFFARGDHFRPERGKDPEQVLRAVARQLGIHP